MATHSPTIPLRVERVPRLKGSAAERLVFRAAIVHLHSGEFDSLRWLAQHPEAPEEVLLLLCEHPGCRDIIAHRADLSETVLDVLANVYGVDEAILTLGKLKYTADTIPLGEFRTFLESHAAHVWLIESLVRLDASSAEKERCLEELVRRHENAVSLSRQFERFRLAREARTESDVQILQRMFESADPHVWLSLAANPAAPREILEQLAEVRNVAGANQIRTLAANALRGAGA